MKTTKYPLTVRELGDMNLTPTEAAARAQAVSK